MSDPIERIREGFRTVELVTNDYDRWQVRIGDIRALLDRLDAAEQENERLRSAINWACGYDEGAPHFGEQPEQDAPYAWRHELRRRAGMPWRVERAGMPWRVEQVSAIDAAMAAEREKE